MCNVHPFSPWYYVFFTTKRKNLSVRAQEGDLKVCQSKQLTNFFHWLFHASVAQSERRKIGNLKVGGSNLARSTKFFSLKFIVSSLSDLSCICLISRISYLNYQKEDGLWHLKKNIYEKKGWRDPALCLKTRQFFDHQAESVLKGCH